MKKTKALLLVLILLVSIEVSFANPSQWAIEEVNKAKEYNLIGDNTSNYQDNLTREEFASMVVRLYEGLSGKLATPISPNPFKDTNSTAVLKANNLGIIGGVGNGMFAPNNHITREQIATMLYRTLNTVNPKLIEGKYNVTFDDKWEISEWALEPIAWMSSKGILGGVGNNRVNPKGNVTKEQGILLVKRTYEKFKSVDEIKNSFLINPVESNLENGKLYENGRLRYEGQLKNGQPHGYGKYYGWGSMNGVAISYLNYEGEFKAGEMDGYGKAYSSGKLRYVGQFKNGREHGFGAKFYGGILESIGEFKDGRICGWGVSYRRGNFEYEYISDNGTVLMILTSNRKKVSSLPVRQAIVTVPTPKNKEEDIWGEDLVEEELIKIVKQYLSNPQETIRALSKPEELRYTGEYRDNWNLIREGYGKLYNKDGNLIYAGSWKNNNMHGFGVTFSFDMVTYVGEFKNAVIEGLGAKFGLYDGKFLRERYVIREHGKRTDVFLTNNFSEVKVPLPFLKNQKYTIENLDDKKLLELINNYENLSKEFRTYIEKEQERNKQEPPTA